MVNQRQSFCQRLRSALNSKFYCQYDLKMPNYRTVVFMHLKMPDLIRPIDSENASLCYFECPLPQSTVGNFKNKL